MADHKRNLKRILINLSEADMDTLGNLAEAIAAPGCRPSRASAVRYLIEQSRSRPLPRLEESQEKSRKGA